MRKLILLAILGFATLAFGADVVPVAVPAQTGVISWFQANTNAVLYMALVISEVMALIPGFQGNGILDTIIKALQALGAKPPA